ncbi:chromosome segregation protein SMC [Thermocladium modestius]|uniref:Chromosome segregation protein SMC n=1 Tax=Thermocladium modestius TaxID=62609 RepID=A0A830GUV0_9CREN|nr:SMC family ATPase [Thermocladium modestius]GGP21211.1 chromosome segregation protein SMC [Thermocladium modestius]
MKYTIGKIELINFKVFKGEKIFELGPGLTLIHGPIGVGKSSLIQSIEYALYGEQLEIKEKIARLSDLINEDSDYAKVGISFLDGKNRLNIERSLVRQKDSARQEIIIDGNKGDENELSKLIGLSDDDFERFILITHRTLEQLAYGSTQRRTVIIDRLFDIDYLDSILRLLPIDAVGKAIDDRKRAIAGAVDARELKQRYGSLEAAKRRAAELREEMERNKAELEKLSAAYGDMLKRRSAIMGKIKDVEAQYRQYIMLSEKLKELQSRGPTSKRSELDVAGEAEVLRAMLMSRLEENLMEAEAQALAKASSMDELLTAMYDSMKRLEERTSEIGDDLRQYKDQSEKSREELEKLRMSVSLMDERIKALEPSVERYRAAEREAGGLPAAKAELERLRARYEEAEREASYKSALSVVISHIRASGDERCPICGSKLEAGALDRIRIDIDEGEVRELRNRIDRLERLVDEMELLHPIYLQYVELEKRAREARDRLEEEINKMERLERAVRDLERKYADLSNFLPVVRERMERLEEAYEEAERVKRMEKIRSELSGLEQLLREHNVNVEEAVRLESELGEVNNRLESIRNRLEVLGSEYMQLETKLSKVESMGIDVENTLKEIEELEGILSRFTRIRDGLLKVQREARQRIIEGLAGEFNSMFKRIYPYGDLGGVAIELEQRERGDYAYALYAIRRGRKVPMSRLSDGQRLTIAISFVLAMYKLIDHKFGFILMDEPLPYVDENVKKALAALLVNILREGITNQVIIATQDSTLMNVISEEAKDTGIGIGTIELGK